MRVLLVSMYPLDRVDSAPQVRIRAMRDALSQRVTLDVVAGFRGARTLGLAGYAASGRLRGLDGIYVESSSFLPAPADVAFTGLARSLGIPVLTYVRDAYQLFPEYYDTRTLKRKLGRALFRPAFRSLMAVSSRVAFPSAGLAAVFGREGDAVLLPPGSSAPVNVARRPDANRLLHVGGLRWSTLGGDLLLTAVERARAAGRAVEVTCVCRPGDEPAQAPDWLHVEHASGDEIHALLPQTIASVIPRHCSAYNDLAVPIKLMEYLSYGRPLLVTDCTETARIVRDAGCGLVVPDTVDGLADGIRRLLDASPADLDAMSLAARRAAEHHSWDDRARRVLDVLRDA